jgi:hypothetical protein
MRARIPVALAASLGFVLSAPAPARAQAAAGASPAAAQPSPLQAGGVPGAEITGELAGQFYDVRSPTGETVLSRRRLTATLGAALYDLLNAPPGDPRAPDLSFRARLRYDADYGATGDTGDPTKASRFVPGFSQGPLDLMYAYVEGRRLLHGLLGFKLGRQYVVDSLGWWSFDGAEASITTPYYAKAEVYGGLEQRGGFPLSTHRFEADGIWRGDRSGFDPSLYPQFQPTGAAPAIGVALESAGVTWLHGRVTYRRVYDTGASNTSDFASGISPPSTYDKSRISSEKLGYAIDATWPEHGGAKAGLVYDFYKNELTSIYASLDAYLGRRITLSADYDYYVPVFDGDSIWNFFAGEPMNDVGLRANVDFDDRLSVAGGAHVRVYTVQTGPFDPGVGAAYMPFGNYLPGLDTFPSNAHPFDEGGNLSARWRRGDTLLALRATGNWGDEGDRVGADVSGSRVFGTRYVASLRTGLWQWDDKLRPDRDATSFNYVAGLGYRLAPRSDATIEWEHDMNQLVGQRFRLMMWLRVAVTK